VRPAGSFDDVQVEPPSVVVRKKLELVVGEFVRKATQSDAVGQERRSMVA
jgi:hypothetical protein